MNIRAIRRGENQGYYPPFVSIEIKRKPRDYRALHKGFKMKIYNIPAHRVNARIDHFGRLGYQLVTVEYNGLFANITFER